VDTKETMAFSRIAGVKPRTETFPLEQAETAYARMMKNEVRFRAVLTP
jgi:D-arabinose 1-dehydrogenase-like Zn-dependent alcohol dehydrogenase